MHYTVAMRFVVCCLLAVSIGAPVSLGKDKDKDKAQGSAPAASSNASKQGKGKGKASGGGAATGARPNGSPNDIRFVDADARIIRDYYQPRMHQLPPGLEKKLMRGGTLPPGWQKKISPFPDELSARLGPLPVGHRRVLYGNTALLIRDATNLILDVIELTR